MTHTTGTTVKRTIMAVGAHADDIEISLGGTVSKYRDNGYNLIYVMATNNMSGDVKERQGDGNIKIWKEPPLLMMKRRKAECDMAVQQMGAMAIHLDHPQRHYYDEVTKGNTEIRYGCNLPQGVEKNIPSILTAHEDEDSIEKLADIMLKNDPECIFTHGLAQYDIEHFATCVLTTKAFWRAVDRGYQGALLQWRESHTLHGGANCRWDTFIDCSEYLNRKMELIGLHQCQMPNADLPDFGHRLLTQWWGKACGRQAAEVFTWVCQPMRRDPAGIVYGELTLELIQNGR